MIWFDLMGGTSPMAPVYCRLLQLGYGGHFAIYETCHFVDLMHG
jgi:hypothetical protein